MIDNLNFKLATACAGTYDGSPPQWEDPCKLVHVYLSMIDGVHVVAWEGTSSFQEWLVDFMGLQVPFFEHPEFGAVHLGFMRDVLSVADDIATYLGHAPWYNTGHSKGGGECILFAAEMKRRGHPPLATRAFEPPQVGGSTLRNYLADQDIAWTATTNVHGRDIVTQVPFGPTWMHCNDPILLTVSDDFDIPTKHRIPAVIAALAPASF